MPEALIRERGAIVRGARDKARMIRRGLIETLHVVERAAKATVVVSDPPGLRESARTCLAEPSADLGDCAWSPPIAASLLFDAQRSAATEVGVRFASTRRWFCASGLCPAVVGSTVAYRDDGHMTTVYARSLNRALQAALLTAS
jgi:hypothetical protein